jgi:hypothetical protein
MHVSEVDYIKGHLIRHTFPPVTSTRLIFLPLRHLTMNLRRRTSQNSYNLYRNQYIYTPTECSLPSPNSYRTPAGYLMPVPEDEPFRETLSLDKEALLKRAEGFLIGIAVLLVLIFRGWLLIGALVGLIVVFLYCRIVWSRDIERYGENYRRWNEERWNVFKPHPLGHYVIRNGHP